MTGHTELSRTAYRVHEQDKRFEVRSAQGRTLMVCNDLASASHYVSLLNEAFKAGYKSGFHDARTGQVQ